MIYFDNSATSRYKPKKMLDEMVKELSDSANGGRSAHGDALKTALKISSCRSVLCDYLNANEIIFTKNCTEAINIVLFG
ncbi:MAG: aminotransferase class V-fold PLP-dependent enzyme, partial [Eubacteriales bacterium]|nr:aminotransferase class V-fold PLP-dependent enzyme [Eubacteriales bacterium]